MLRGTISALRCIAVVLRTQIYANDLTKRVARYDEADLCPEKVNCSARRRVVARLSRWPNYI